MVISKVRHVVITRFAIQTHFGRHDGWHRKPDWIEHRAGLFREHTIPSINGQTSKDFDWIALVDPSVSVRPHLGPRGIYVDYESRGDLLTYLRDTSDGEQWIMSSRLDSDDSYSPTFIAETRRVFDMLASDGNPSEWVNPIRGYRQTGDSSCVVDYRCNPFQTRRSAWNEGEVGLPYDIDHMVTKAVDYGHDTALWKQIIHDRNVFNGVRRSDD